MEKSNIKDIENGRAKFAYDCANVGKNIKDLYKLDNIYYKDDKYKSYVENIPMLIKTNGLGQTFAYVLSKCQKKKDTKVAGSEKNPKNAYDLIYKQTLDWLKKDFKNLLDPIGENNDLSYIIISKNSVDYRMLTNEVLALFLWLRRFAEGLIEDKEDEKQERE